MKIGIITFHHTTNYGATLQAYALSKALSAWGHSVEIIDYRPKGAVGFYVKQLLPIKNKKFDWNKDFYRHILKAFRMRKFLVSSLNLSKLKCYSNYNLRAIFEAANYDAIITGSDQVWCLNTKFRGFDPAYFLDFFEAGENCLKISYAPSVGETKSFGDKRAEICDLIEKFDYVSVRDHHSKSVLQKECGVTATKVLDPTFLVSYDDILTPPDTAAPYLLVYNHKKLNNLQEQAIKEIARVKNLKIISVGDIWSVADHSKIAVHPKEWIGYFKQASYVFTNTFHGTIFSLLFRKDFTVFVGEGKRNKIHDLLGSLELETRITTTDPGAEEPDISAIDYCVVERKLNPQIRDSKAFLARIFDRAYLPVSGGV
ncbi:MAG: polysaccharide pyruvyl transferase family protein [Cyanobacteria bacterium P01_H01_bin.26]